DDGGGVPVQGVADGAPPGLGVVDARGLSEAGLVAQAQAILDAPFDLRRGPVVRLVWLDRGDEGGVLVLVNAHMFADLGAVDIIFYELGGFYAEAALGLAFAPPPPGVFGEQVLRYAAELERRRVDDEAYWTRRLEGATPALAVADGRPPARGGRRGRLARRLLDASESARFGGLKRASSSSTFRLLVAAWAAVLARHGRQHDLLVGTNVRAAPPGADYTLGNFVNALPLRVTLPEGLPFGALVSAVGAEVAEVQARGLYPAEWLARLPAPMADGGLPTFRTLVGLGRMRHAADLTPAFLASVGAPWRGRLGPLPVVGALALDQHPGQLELELLAVEVAGELGVELAYDADVFSAPAAERLVDQLRALLLGAIEDPSRPVDELPLLGEAERETLRRWSRDPRPRPRETALRLFEAQAERAPDAVAIELGQGRLTSGELEAEANRLAAALRARGVGPEARVGVLLSRSARAPVAFLATWKAGGAYVPLDPTDAPARIRQIVEAARPALIVVEGATAAVDAGDVPRLDLDRDARALAALPDARPAAAGGPGSLAYVIFTSGTTGRPKGVLVEHAGVHNYALDVAERWRLGPGARALAFASFAFDSSVAEVYGALCSGATLVVRPDAIKGGRELEALLRAGRITHASMPPAVWRTLGGASALPALGVCVTCGDAASPDFAAAWGGGRLLLNEYGPTEITVCATSKELAPGGRVTIGRPIANAEAYVLDGGRRPLPIGARGELYLGGVGVARGYEARPGLTAERFVAAEPFVGEPRRLYRTGDLARWTEGGELEFLGRDDEQVKIRGFRVELGEVEAALRAVPGVGDAVASAALHRGRRALVGYYVPSTAPGPAEGEVREALAASLPPFMIPSRLCRIDRVPLSDRGKVDRAALPPVEEAAAPAAPAGGAPLADVVLDAFRRTLGRDDFGPEDSFFDAGGDSLLAVELVSLIGQRSEREVPVSHVFAAPSPRGLLELLARGGEGPAPAEGGGLVFLPPPGGSTALYAALYAALAAPGRAVLADAAPGSLDALVEHYAAIAAARPGCVLVGWSSGGELALGVAARLEARAVAVAGLVLLDVHPAERARAASALAR
ncbi:MAG TPA: amino acid adenylation domain-containing protein, partial [Polyangiaceae bacterium]|nr:amino acid adenylation domain-containing protein [Polyangiaceae bacterium]